VVQLGLAQQKAGIRGVIGGHQAATFANKLFQNKDGMACLGLYLSNLKIGMYGSWHIFAIAPSMAQ